MSGRISGVYSVFDAKAELFGQPLFAANVAVAIRAFTAAVQSEDHDFHKFAEDYTLFEIASFDAETGLFNVLDTPKPLVRAQLCLKKKENGGA